MVVCREKYKNMKSISFSFYFPLNRILRICMHLFNKKKLSSGTKLAIHRSIYRSTVLYGSESWVDSGYLVRDLEVSNMIILRSIAKVNRREQWENHVRNDIRESLG